MGQIHTAAIPMMSSTTQIYLPTKTGTITKPQMMFMVANTQMVARHIDRVQD